MIQVIFMLDTSASMYGTGLACIEENYEVVRKSLGQLAHQEVQCTVVAYNSDITVLHQQVQLDEALLPTISAERVSNIRQAWEWYITFSTELDAAEKDAMVVLWFTDGHSTDRLERIADLPRPEHAIVHHLGIACGQDTSFEHFGVFLTKNLVLRQYSSVQLCDYITALVQGQED